MSQTDLIDSCRHGRPKLRRAGPLASIGMVVQLLSGCAAGAPPATFDLTAPARDVPERPLRGQLVVAEPTASSPYDGDRIVIRTGPESLALLKGTQWIGQLPHLVQSRLIQTFENDHLLRSVGYPGQGITADVVLNSEIRRFEVDAQTGVATVEISGKLINVSGHILAAQIFSAQAPGSAEDGTRASAALDTALGQVMKEIVVWAAAKL